MALATTLNNLANALGEQGDLSGSIKMLNEALADVPGGRG